MSNDTADFFYKKINEDLRTGGVDVQAEDIIDIIEGAGWGYALSTQDELGGFLMSSFYTQTIWSTSSLTSKQF